MSARNNGVSLKFIGFFVFLAVTMNCLSWVSGGATDNKEGEGCSCYYDFAGYEDTVSCDPNCGTCSDKDPDQNLGIEYYSGCSAVNETCSVTPTYNGDPITSFDGICEYNNDAKSLCCRVDPSSDTFGVGGIMCNCVKST